MTRSRKNKPMLQKNYDVITICNALMDIVVDASEDDIQRFALTKGHMHLVDANKQKELLQHFSSRQQTIELGGSAMNAVRALALLKKKAIFVGMVAQDSFGAQIQKRMSELDITSHLHTSTQEPTGTCLILVTPDGERTMNTHLGASRLYNKQVIPSDELSQTSVLHISGYQWDTEDQKQAIGTALGLAEKAGSLVSFDVADPHVVSVHGADFRKVIENHADIVFANREESFLLYGLNPEETAQKISDMGAMAVIKLGAEGALIQKGKDKVRVQSVKTHVVDTTGAGDMFAAGVLYGLISALPLSDCGKIAALLASDVISRYGAHLSDEVISQVLNYKAT